MGARVVRATTSGFPPEGYQVKLQSVRHHVRNVTWRGLRSGAVGAALCAVMLPVAASAASAAVPLGTVPAVAGPAVREVALADGVSSAMLLSQPLLPPGDEEPQPLRDGPNRTTPAPAQQDEPPSETSVWAVIGMTALVVVSLGLTIVAGTTLWWMLHAWRTPQALVATRFSATPVPPRRSFSLLVPARHEQEVLGDTLDRLAELDHPNFEIIAIIGHDDPETEAVARAAEARHPGLVRVVIDSNVPKNKPKGMNTALPECRGDVVGVFDAEDEVHPRLLRLVDARFSETGADIVQGGVQLMNVQSSWWSLRNCLEYYFWFRSRLHFHAEARFIPLGGNTVFMRTDLLRKAGGWDAECLAEDCEIGVRLSTEGARVAVAYDPEVVTREETPDSLGSLLKQRTRWSQGFLQVLNKGEWKRLPTWRQRALARYTLAMPFLQAFTGVMIPISVALILFARVPVLVALVTFLPIVPTLIILSVEAAGLGDFARSYGVRVRPRDYVRLVLGTFPYQVVLAAAAVRAVVREARGDGSWEKTAHTGAHRVSAPGASALPTTVVRPAEQPLTVREAVGAGADAGLIDLTAAEGRQSAAMEARR